MSPALAASASITSAGPLTLVEISDLLNCSVNHTGDSAGEFYGGTACGTLVATGGTLYGPASIPAGGGAAPRTAFTPVSQSAVTGTGTSVDPYQVVTVVDLGSTGLRITETDSYVVGQETYRTDVAIGNSGNASASGILYRAGDCYLQNSDSGFGAADATSGAVSCVAAVLDESTGTTVPGTRIEQWYPLSAGSHYYESGFGTVWSRIGSQLAFADSCEQCANDIDNGAGLSWDVTIPAGGSVTRSHLTVFSPLGIVPLTTTKTAASSTVSAGGTDSYTITVANPNTTAATLTSITDTLPAGFTYTAGSTTGATTANPGIVGQVLTWTGSFVVPASGSISLTFSVTASSTPGSYTNQAGATAESPYVVVGSGQTAPVTVGGGGVTPLTTTKTAASSTVSAGGSDSYTITVANPNTSAVTLTSITDTLPAGFTYTAGSTTGATTANPGIVGQVLTWTGSFVVPASGSITLTFGVTASSTPGTYTNLAGATAESPYVVSGSGQTAPVTVGGGGVTPPPNETARLTLTKTVVNTGGGTALATDWTLSATGRTTISGHTGGAAITNAFVLAGTYTLAESGGPTSGYAPGAWSCTGATLTGTSVLLVADATVTCSITNTFGQTPAPTPTPVATPTPAATPTPRPTRTPAVTLPPTSTIGASTGGSTGPLVPISIALLLSAATGFVLIRRPKSR